MSLPVKFTIAVPGQEALSLGLQRFAAGIEDLPKFWTDYFVPSWYALMDQQYASEGEFTGAHWDALTARYAAWKEKHWPGRPIGVLTGAARASLVGPGEGSVLNISKDKLAVGTSLGHPIYLQLGTRRMVARPPMRIDQAFMLDCGRLLQKFAVDRAKEARLAAG